MTDVGNDFIMPARRFHLDLHPQKPPKLSQPLYFFSSGQSSSGVNMQVRPRRGPQRQTPFPIFRNRPSGANRQRFHSPRSKPPLLPCKCFPSHCPRHIRDQNILHGPWHYLSDHLPDTVHRVQHTIKSLPKRIFCKSRSAKSHHGFALQLSSLSSFLPQTTILSQIFLSRTAIASEAPRSPGPKIATCSKIGIDTVGLDLVLILRMY